MCFYKVLWSCFLNDILTVPLLLCELFARSHEFDIDTMEESLTELLEFGACRVVDRVIYNV